MNGSDTAIAAVAALDEPTRRRLYAFVASAREPVSRDEAAQAVGVARETAAFHLDRLADDGLLQVSHRRLSGRTGPGAGRPSKLYRRAEQDIAVSLPPRHYELAGELLAAAVEDAEASVLTAGEALARRARRTGRELAVASTSLDPVEVLASQGFEPFSTSDGVILRNCPFHRLAQAHTELVCGMNLHLVGGVLDELAGSGYVAELDPAPDRCCVVLRADAPDAG